ncbi:MAG: YggT family protein [Kiloniellales bacterium]|nr:YggT family protein [Kiloniellales bacterium]MDJ0971491.1 YggT family protein [Kiloniellales bacterium]MDJ0980431.1 YggT family protein [Kiloniellales bacterium]
MIIVDPLLIIVLWLIRAYIWVIIIGVILSWLINFQVVNSYNRFVFLVQDLTNRLTEPALGPIRRFLPNLGGIDISPIILILGLWFLEMVIVNLRISMLSAGAGL